MSKVSVAEPNNFCNFPTNNFFLSLLTCTVLGQHYLVEETVKKYVALYLNNDHLPPLLGVALQLRTVLKAFVFDEVRQTSYKLV